MWRDSSGALGALLFVVMHMTQTTQGPAAAHEVCQRHDRGKSAARVLGGREQKQTGCLLVPALRGGGGSGSETSRVDCTACGQAVRH